MKNRFQLTLLVVLLTITTPYLWSQTSKYGTISYAKAINVSGKQRMLSQKMAKAYLLQAKGINSMKIEKELKSSIFIFDRQLQILEKNGRSTTEKFALKKTRKLWTNFKILVETKPNYNTAKKIMELNTPLLKSCHQLVLAILENSIQKNDFSQETDPELMKIINMSGKQRMLSQRFCLYYTASNMFDNDKSKFTATINTIYNEFDNAIGELLINNYNTTKIEEEMGTIMAEWEKIQNNKMGLPLKEVFVSTNFLTTKFNIITGMYEGLILDNQ